MAHQSGDKTQTELAGNIADSLNEASRRLTAKRKLVVAVNRGPLYFTEEHSGQIVPKRDNSRGTEMFEPLSYIPISWVAGAVSAADRNAANDVSDEESALKSDVLPSEWSVRFVSPPRRVHHKFYNLICNPLLWFLLHRSWSPTFTPNIGQQEHDAWDRGYRAVNELFLNEILDAAGDEQLVLVSRDYQLMLVPGMVRDRQPDAVIHHSFDTPWVWPDDLQILPSSWRDEILTSLLSADVISFQSETDITAFLACVARFVHDAVPNTEANGRSVSYENREVKLTVAPPAVRTAKFAQVTEFESTQRFIENLADDAVAHTFVTVDRAEPHKNIVRSINAFGELLKLQPELAAQTRFLLFLTSGSAHISAYKRVSDEIRRAARRVNEKAKNFSPVRVVEENNFYRSVAALTVYDTLVSVPVVDRASRSVYDGPLVNTEHGGMIVSETNAAADLLDENVSIVGFSDISAIAEAMSAAISEPAAAKNLKSDRIKETILSIRSSDSIRTVIRDIDDVLGSR
jgi:trehalose 6-phosphate synthase